MEHLDNDYIDYEEESYQKYLRSPRYHLDYYLEVIDPWLIPIQRIFVISLLLSVLFP